VERIKGRAQPIDGSPRFQSLMKTQTEIPMKQWVSERAQELKVSTSAVEQRSAHGARRWRLCRRIISAHCTPALLMADTRSTQGHSRQHEEMTVGSTLPQPPFARYAASPTAR
jgi:hypothetical protein